MSKFLKENWVILFLPLIFFVFGGCASYNKLVFDMPEFPPPYQSSVQLHTTGAKNVNFDILGEGYGEATGYILFGGFIVVSPDAMAAYKKAVNSRRGDILLETRAQVTTSGLFPPFVFQVSKVKIVWWGQSCEL